MKKKITQVLKHKSLNTVTPIKLKNKVEENSYNLLEYTDETLIYILNQDETNHLFAQSKNYIENDKTNILVSYLYLVNKNTGFYNDYVDKIVTFMYKIYEATDLENELLCRIFSIIAETCTDYNHNQRDKMFFMAFSFLTKRRNLKNATRIKAFGLIICISNSNFTYLSELIKEYDNISDFKYNKLQFNDHVIINFLYYLYKNDEKNAAEVENIIDNCMKSNLASLLKLTKNAVENLQNEECRTFVMFIITRLFVRENGFIDFISIMPKIIIYLQDNAAIPFDKYLYKNLKCEETNQILKLLCVNLFNYIKIKESKKYYALKCFKYMKFDFLNAKDQSTLISLLIYNFQNSKNKLKELIIQILDNLSYTKLFYLLESTSDTDSIALKKKAFIIMLKYLSNTSKHRDIVLAYINYLKDKDMHDFIIKSFDFNTKWGTLENNFSLSVEEKRKKEQEEYYTKKHFIDVFTQYVYFEYNKDFIKNIDLQLGLFVPKDDIIYRINFLKHYAKYNYDKFGDIQLDLITLLSNNQSNVPFISEIYQIFVILLEGNEFNLYFKEALVSIASNGLNNIKTLRDCGKILQKLNTDLENNQNPLVQASMGLSMYIDEFDYDFHVPDKILGYLYYIENNQNDKSIIKHINAIITILESSKNDSSYNICHINVIKHIRRILQKNNQHSYYNIISAKQQYFYDLILENNKDYSFSAHKLILMALDKKLILPHTSIIYIMFFFTFNYNNHVKNIIKLYSLEIINYLEIYIQHITKYTQKSLKMITKENLMLYFIYTNIKSEKHKLKLINKLFKIIENNNALSILIILKNLSYFDLSKNIKKIVLDSINLHISNLELCFGEADTKGAILMHLLRLYKKANKNKIEYNASYEELLYRNDEIELEILNRQLKYKLSQNK